MLKIFKNELDSEVVKKIDSIEDNCWINLVKPTNDEIKLVVETLGIDEDLITKVLDEEELPRIETTDNATLIVVDCPYWIDTHVKNNYITYLRLLGFHRNASFILKEIKQKAQIPVINKVADASSLLSCRQFSDFQRDLSASDLYRQVYAFTYHQTMPTEYEHTVIIHDNPHTF